MKRRKMRRFSRRSPRRRNTPIKLQRRSASSTTFCSLNTNDLAEEELRQPWIRQSPTYRLKSNFKNVDVDSTKIQASKAL
ncbi:hypothetical protein BLA29_013647 [Euroglyphus maynei]|uniref:Uncharacterized protein n=1 Tax=Euroglyphus maynei TaxID=6958 RepID=A0A1Y3BSL8_EURMA|nr:hypothetical protein BLA29_013647 [Euroglyphus maynei]